MKRLRAIISGRVQGVGYRAAVQKRIMLIDGATGFIKNLPDGTVEIVTEGPEHIFEAVLDIAREGSFWSSVDEIDTEYGSAKGSFTEFTIEY